MESSVGVKKGDQGNKHSDRYLFFSFGLHLCAVTFIYAMRIIDTTLFNKIFTDKKSDHDKLFINQFCKKGCEHRLTYRYIFDIF